MFAGMHLDAAARTNMTLTSLGSNLGAARRVSKGHGNFRRMREILRMAAVDDLAEARGLLAKGRIDESAVGRKKDKREEEEKRKLEIRCVPQMGALIVAHSVERPRV